MSKILKLLRSALHNSNANEASQALKVAAGLMQVNSINPADFLIIKQDEHDSSSDLFLMQRKIEALQSEIEHLRAQRHPNSDDLRQQLREAKSHAVKWHRRANELDEESIAYAKSSALYGAEVKKLQEKILLNEKFNRYAVAIMIIELIAVLFLIK